MSFRFLSFFAFLSLMLSCAGVAHAVDAGEWYLGAAVNVGGADTEFEHGATTDKVEYSIDTGATGTLGFKYDSGIRTEFEFGVRKSDVSNVDTSILISDGGTARADLFMLNVIYDITNSTFITPYLGLGIGMAQLTYDNVHQISGSTVDDKDYLVAGQGIAGLFYSVNDNWDFYTDFRYMVTARQTAETASAIELEGDYKSMSISFGLLYGF